MNLKLKQILILSLLFFIFTSCKTTISSISDVSETKGYEVIKTSYAKKHWEEVTHDISEFRVRYPYSKYSAELELIQADSFFQAQNYPTAAVTYEDFIRRNPHDSHLPFAYFRIAESYDLDSQKDIDRSQTNTEKALEKYEAFLVKFPDSKEFDTKARNRVKILRKRLADHSLFIATFYWDQRLYAAALMRYLYLLDNFPELPEITKIAKKNGAFCYKKLAAMLEKHPKSEEFIFFRNETPQSLREKGKILGGTK